MSNTTAAKFPGASIRRQADNTCRREKRVRRLNEDKVREPWSRFEPRRHCSERDDFCVRGFEGRERSKSPKISELETTMAKRKQEFQIQGSEYKAEVDELRKALENLQTRDKQTIETPQREKAALKQNIATLRVSLMKADESTRQGVNMVAMLYKFAEEARGRVAGLSQERDELAGRANELEAEIRNDLVDRVDGTDETLACAAKIFKNGDIDAGFQYSN